MVKESDSTVPRPVMRLAPTPCYAPVAVDDDVVVATGTSSYSERPDGPIVRIYHNCFVMRFDDEGRCREFTEYSHSAAVTEASARPPFGP